MVSNLLDSDYKMEKGHKKKKSKKKRNAPLNGGAGELIEQFKEYNSNQSHSTNQEFDLCTPSTSNPKIRYMVFT